MTKITIFGHTKDLVIKYSENMWSLTTFDKLNKEDIFRMQDNPTTFFKLESHLNSIHDSLYAPASIYNDLEREALFTDMREKKLDNT